MYRQHPIHNLKTTKIHFTNKQEEENGFYMLMTSGMPIHALDNGRYLVNLTQRRILEDNGIQYQLED
jgi:hypothetical protein